MTKKKPVTVQEESQRTDEVMTCICQGPTSLARGQLLDADMRGWVWLRGRRTDPGSAVMTPICSRCGEKSLGALAGTLQARQTAG